MVTTLSRPSVISITEAEKTSIYHLIRTWGAMSADEVASATKLDETEVEFYLALQAGLGHMGYAQGRYVTRE